MLRIHAAWRELARTVVFHAGLLLVAAVTLPAAAGGTAPSALLTIDQNRTTVVDRVVTQWGDALVASGAGVSREQLQAMLAGMRSDYLLAASLAGTLEGLRNVIANAITANGPVAASLIATKALGDAGDDLVYTPVVPCRIVDTRGFGGTFAAAGETRSYHAYLTSGTFATQGGAATNCGIPANPSVVALNIATVGGAGFLTAWPFNTTQPLASVLNPAPGQIVADAALVPICAPSCAFDFSVFTFGAQMIVDIVGYFKPPAAPIGTVSSVATGTGLTGGPITSTGTISIANGGVGTAQLATNAVTQAKLSPSSGGTAGKVLGTDGTNLLWQADANSGGTVTSVGTGSGLTGGPITGTGTVNLATTNLLPTVACTSNQVPKWSGSAWVCGNDNNSGGTVTAVTASAPLASSGGTTPNLSLSGIVAMANGGTGVASSGAAGNVLRSNGANWTAAALQASDIPSLAASYIQNTASLQPSSSFNISGDGFIGGNLGIGTTTPGNRLTVQTSAAGFGIAHSGLGVDIATYIDGSGGWLGTVSNHPLFFYTNNSVQEMTLDTSGRLGVGTTTPSSPLTVAGTIESTIGGVKFPDATVQTSAAAQRFYSSGNGNVNQNLAGFGIFSLFCSSGNATMQFQNLSGGSMSLWAQRATTSQVTFQTVANLGSPLIFLAASQPVTDRITLQASTGTHSKTFDAWIVANGTTCTLNLILTTD